MISETQSDTTFQDRIKLPITFDYSKLQAEYKALNLAGFTYYNVIPLRSPAHLVDTSLPFPPPADDYADGSWTDWLDTEELKMSPYLNEVVDYFKANTKVTLVRVLRLAPKSTVDEHRDLTLGLEVEKSVVRLTVPIFSNDEIQFFLNQTEVPLQLGECWYMRLTDPHKVVNNSEEERVNLTIDMIPNEWLKGLIKSGESFE
tara:strand:+ start:369 stop:974 length:606 start_codon:yes stop_codon:yes gene_type:complete